MYNRLTLQPLNMPHGMCKYLAEKCGASMSTASNAINGKTASKKALECRKAAIAKLMEENTFHVYNPDINTEGLI